MANAKSPECNSISTTEVAQVEITEAGFNGVKLVRDISIPRHLPESLTLISHSDTVQWEDTSQLILLK